MRRAARVDGNHSRIKKALKRIGAVVKDVSALGEMGCDLIAGFRGAWFLLEVKDSSKFPKKFFSGNSEYQEEYLQKQLTENEKSMKQLSELIEAPYYVVYDIDSAMRAIGANKPKWQ